MEYFEELLKVLNNETDIAIATHATIQVAMKNIAKTFKALNDYLTQLYFNDMLTPYAYNALMDKARETKTKVEKEIISIYAICEF